MRETYLVIQRWTGSWWEVLPYRYETMEGAVATQDWYRTQGQQVRIAKAICEITYEPLEG